LFASAIRSRESEPRYVWASKYPAFVHYDPKSTTASFQPNERDFTYSKYRPDLAALGAKDGFVISGLAMDNNDPLSRRDEGLEFLDMTSKVDVALVESNHVGVGESDDGDRQEDLYKITNNSSAVVDTRLLIIVKGLSEGFELDNASGLTRTGDPYLRVFLPNGVLLPGQSIVKSLVFERQTHEPPANYSLTFLSGQGKP